METGRGVVRMLNSANTGIRIGPYAVMSGALIAAVSASSSVAGLFSEDLHMLGRRYQTDSLQNRCLVRS